MVHNIDHTEQIGLTGSHLVGWANGFGDGELFMCEVTLHVEI